MRPSNLQRPTGRQAGVDYGPGIAKIWLDEHGRFRFGKYRLCLADEVAQDDPDYIRWVLEECDDMDEGDREILESIASYRGINY